MVKQAVHVSAKRNRSTTWLISRSRAFKLDYHNAINSFHFKYTSKNLSCQLLGILSQWLMCTSAARTEPKLSVFPSSTCVTLYPDLLSNPSTLEKNLTTGTERSNCWSHLHAYTCSTNTHGRSGQLILNFKDYRFTKTDDLAIANFKRTNNMWHSLRNYWRKCCT